MNALNSLNTHASNMIKSIVKDSPSKKTYIRNFFREANNNQQGNALISYYTEYNKLKAKDSSFTTDMYKRFRSLPQLIEDEINGIPALEKEAFVFSNTLEKLYPTSLEKRISLASQGAVTADKVEPKSRFKKFMVVINQLIRNA